jgi:concentrative nucleoside transporter, CNT family
MLPLPSALGVFALALPLIGAPSALSFHWKAIAMLIVLLALVSLTNQVISLLPDVLGAPLTLQRIVGWAWRPWHC